MIRIGEESGDPSASIVPGATATNTVQMGVGRNFKLARTAGGAVRIVLYFNAYVHDARFTLTRETNLTPKFFSTKRSL